MGHAVRTIAAPPQAAVDAMFRQAGVIQVDTLDEMFDVAQLVAHQPLPRGRRVADRRQLRRARACSPPTPPPRSGSWSTSRSRSAPTRPAEDFEDALDAAIDDPEVDSVVAVYIPPLERLRRGGRQRAGRRGGAVRQAAGLDVPRRRGRPRAAPGARRGRLDRRAAARSRRTPRSRPPSGRSPRVVEYAVWLRTAARPSWSPRRASTRWRAKRLVHAAAAPTPEGDATSTVDELHRRCSAAYGIDLWERSPGRPPLDEAVAGRPSELGWDVVLKATADHLRERPDLAHVWRNIDTEAEMRDAWETHAGR